jgi:hypothetical protein
VARAFEEPEVLEGTAVWLVISDAVDPAALVERLDANGRTGATITRW